MIEINCTQCRELLQIDDAFAGGVCRCKFCGAIQTVPKRLKGTGGNGDGGEMAAVGAGSGDAIYGSKRTVVDTGSGTGLDDLAGIVASSGLAGSHLRKPAQRQSATAAAVRQVGQAVGAGRPAAGASNRTMLLLGAAGGVIAVLLIVIVVMALRDPPQGAATIAANNTTTAGGANAARTNPQPNPNTPTVTPPTPPPPPRVSGPSFLGQKLDGNNVLYVIDRGQASLAEGRLEGVKRATLASVKSLGPNKKFAVMFWQPHSDKSEAFTAFVPANADNIKKLQKQLEETFGSGQTRPPNGMTKAFKAGADAMVYVPIKSFVTDDIVKPVTEKRTSAGSKVKVHCFSLDQPDLASALKPLAEQTKGTYRDVPLSELKLITE